MILEDGPLFIADTQVHPNRRPSRSPRPPSAPRAMSAASGSSRKIALCAHSQFGNLDSESGGGCARARDPRRHAARFRYEGEMHADTALDPELRARILPETGWKGRPTC
jgi:malate dehydrogenase (oxaloacetate-decarboxylating)(NADP+)